MENVTISVKRFEELLYKEASYEIKRAELQSAGYVSSLDRALFGLPEKPQGCVAPDEDDF